jgi:hypothetical protein
MLKRLSTTPIRLLVCASWIPHGLIWWTADQRRARFDGVADEFATGVTGGWQRERTLPALDHTLTGGAIANEN